MPGLRPTMIEDASIVTARFFEGIAQDRHAVEGSEMVDGFGERNRVGRKPSRVDGHWPERVAEDVPQEMSLGIAFSLVRGIRDSSGKFKLIAHGGAGMLWQLFREKHRLPGSDPGGPHTCLDGRDSGVDCRLSQHRTCRTRRVPNTLDFRFARTTVGVSLRNLNGAVKMFVGQKMDDRDVTIRNPSLTT